MDETDVLWWVSAIEAVLLILAVIALTRAFWERQALKGAVDDAMREKERRVKTEDELRRLKGALAQTEDFYRDLEKRHDLLAKQNEEYEAEVGMLEKRACDLVRERDDLASRIRQVTDERDNANDAMHEAAAKSVEQATLIEELRTTRLHLDRGIEALKERAKKWQDAYRQLEEQVDSIDASRKEVLSRLAWWEDHARQARELLSV